MSRKGGTGEKLGLEIEQVVMRQGTRSYIRKYGSWRLVKRVIVGKE